MIEFVLFAQFALAHPVAIDGDTLREGDVRYRVENIDAPELGRRAECAEERALAEAARAYLDQWLADAGRVEAIGRGRLDRYGRVIARIEIDGVDVGERLMSRGLARAWRGRKADFCGG
jgi:endonuclease YncB( thermonuclease family)